jgi:regulator of replication initiation timing
MSEKEQLDMVYKEMHLVHKEYMQLQEDYQKELKNTTALAATIGELWESIAKLKTENYALKEENRKLKGALLPQN